MNISEVLKTIKPYNTLGMNIESEGSDSLTFRIPLAENYNDKNTMFAGSIYSVMVLCGWALAYITVNGENKMYDIVIKHSDIDYRSPVKTDARGVAAFAGKAAVKANGNISLPVVVSVKDINDIVCAEFSGEFIGIRI